MIALRVLRPERVAAEKPARRTTREPAYSAAS